MVAAEEARQVAAEDSLIQAAIDFDRARVDALRLQKERNDSPECTDPGERTEGIGVQSYIVTDACWRTKRRHNMEGEVVGRSEKWCDECSARQRLHDAMHDARALRGAALRRLTHWRQKLETG